MRKSIVVVAGALFALLASPSSALVGVAPLLLGGCLYDGSEVCDDAQKEAFAETAYYCGANNTVCTKISEESYLGVTISCEYLCQCAGN